MFVSFISVFTGIRIVTLVTRESTPLVLNLFFPRIIFSKKYPMDHFAMLTPRSWTTSQNYVARRSGRVFLVLYSLWTTRNSRWTTGGPTRAGWEWLVYAIW